MMHPNRTTKPTVLALACILPLGLFLYEYLAAQNGHLSLVKTLTATSDSRQAQVNNELEGKPEERIEKLEKLSIQTTRADGDTDVNSATKESPTIVPSKSILQQNAELSANEIRVKSLLEIAKKPITSVDESVDSHTTGENAEGELILPALKVDAQWSKALITALLREGKVRVIATHNNRQYFDFKMKGDSLHQGSFTPLKVYDRLSDRRVLLKPSSGKVYHELMTAYKLSGRPADKPTLMIRFTRQFNHEITQQQLALVKVDEVRENREDMQETMQETMQTPRQAAMPTTVLAFTTVNGASQYTISIQ